MELDRHAQGQQQQLTQHAEQCGGEPSKQVTTLLRAGQLLVQRGIVRPMRPDKLARLILPLRQWGISIPTGYAIGAIRHPDRPAVIDERGALSYAEFDLRTTRLAHGLREQGLRSGDRAGLLCRNHHGFLEAIVACAKIGVDVVLLNTGLSRQQLTQVVPEQRIALLVLDEEFVEHVAGLPEGLPKLLAWTDGSTDHATLEHLIGRSPASSLPRQDRHARMIVLTSGTTGTPKGARRPDPSSLMPVASLLSMLPLRAGERTLITSPIFHTWGLAAFQLAAVLGSTLVLRRKFDAQQTLITIQRHQCSSMFAVPVMLQRILDLPEHQRRPYDHSSLQAVACSGSALTAPLAKRFQQEFGPVLYNFYGSTEVSWASIATPDDLREAPGTAGRPPLGTEVRVLDEHGAPLPTGQRGRIFVGNAMLFDGYTNGSGRERRNGLMSTGDLGHFDEAGRLFVDGREDDMVISGGENLYPQEVEDVIAALPEVTEVAVTGVPDDEFGNRLAAYVVLRDGQQLDADSIRDHVRGKLASFSVPRDVVFLDALPRNATGKVVARELPPPEQHV